MKRYPHILIILSFLILIIFGAACQFTLKPLVAQERMKGSSQIPKKQVTEEVSKVIPEEKPSVIHRSVEIDSKTLNYTTTAGYMPMKDESGKLKANLFFTAYTKDEQENQSQRPITFAFNGGPGAASIFLHLAALGPKRILLTEKGEALPPPYKLVENRYTWLDFTDLVFIDPVGTGYSRPAPEEDHSTLFDKISSMVIAKIYRRGKLWDNESRRAVKLPPG
jgi:carboxypeptidase C (cathepsin A)